MRQDAKDNYDKIKHHARLLFEQHGVDNVSMNQIASQLNIGSGTLYRHFKDKGVLCFHLLDEDFNKLFEFFDHVLAQHSTRFEQLDAMLHAILLFKQDNASLLLCIEQHEMKYLFKETAYYNRLFNAFETIFKNDENAAFKTDMLLNALTTRSFQHQIHYRGLSINHFKNNLLTLFITQS